MLSVRLNLLRSDVDGLRAADEMVDGAGGGLDEGVSKKC